MFKIKMENISKYIKIKATYLKIVKRSLKFLENPTNWLFKDCTSCKKW